MKKTKKYSNLTNLDSIQDFLHGYGIASALFLSIETTGLSPAKHALYLIGTAYLENGQLATEQFFADKNDESLLLEELSALCNRHAFDAIMTFHGIGFVFPFLKGRCEQLGNTSLPDLVYNNKNYVDLFKIYSAYRHIFHLENYKQQTLENFLGMERKTCISGKELVKIYKSYAKKPDDASEQLLLAHNLESLLGMAGLLSLYAYECFFDGSFQIIGHAISEYRKMDGTPAKELTITCLPSRPLPAAVSCGNQHFYLHLEKESAAFRVPIYEGTLKYFYPNYKDYYYLPQEDMAIHKSVAAYVDRAHRRKATPANCYGKKTGLFLPQLETEITPAFYIAHKDTVSYFELPESLDGTADEDDILKRYCMHMLRMLYSMP